MANIYQNESSFVYALLACNFNGFFFKKTGILSANFSSVGIVLVSTVFLNSAFKVSQQLFLPIFKIFAGIFLNDLFVLRLLNCFSISDKETLLNKNGVVTPDVVLIAKILDDFYT